ncbi:MAG: glycosyltransferase family 9 protein [Desulfobacteraceae bacterium]|nr:glycosyltransferase family 9 protein [Desulfobacteraceae bacterium]
MKLQTKRLIDYYVGGFLMVALKPMVMLLGLIMKRNHALHVRGDICFIKMLGGGSLVIAYPTLLGLRERYPSSKIVLITTKSIKPLAETLGVFDRIDAIDDSSVLRLAVSSVSCIIRNFRTDTLIDLEVYSRLTTIFSTLTCARNRIGFYLESVFWRKYLSTHLIFFQRFSSTHYWYDAIAQLLDAQPASVQKCRDKFLQILNTGGKKETTAKRIAIGHGCSDLSKERMLTPDQWVSVFEKHADSTNTTEFIFLGTNDERNLADDIIKNISLKFPSFQFKNLCGELSFAESLKALSACQEFWGIDSALLHFARLLGLKCLSFWGPTAPSTVLRPHPELDETVIYEKVPCSPCVHIAEDPPCNGNNICIQNLFKPQLKDASGIWLIKM